MKFLKQILPFLYNDAETLGISLFPAKRARPEPIVNEVYNEDLLTAFDSMMAVKNAPDTDGQKIRILLKLKQETKTTHRPRSLGVVSPEGNPIQEHDVTGAYALRALLSVHNEPFMKTLFKNRDLYNQYRVYNVSSKGGTYDWSHYDNNNSAVTFYETMINGCRLQYIDTPLVQEAYHLVFPERLNKDTASKNTYTELDYTILKNLMQRNPDAIQSFMVDDFFHNYAREKDSITAGYYQDHIEHIYQKRPELVQSKHLSLLSKGSVPQKNTHLLHQGYTALPELMTHDLMSYFVRTSYDVINQDLSAKKNTIDQIETLKSPYVDQHQKAKIRNNMTSYKKPEDPLRRAFTEYRDTVSDFIEKNPVESLPENLVGFLRPPEAIQKAGLPMNM